MSDAGSAERIKQFKIFRGAGDAALAGLRLANLLDRIQPQTVLIRDFDSLVEQQANDFVAIGSDADARTARDQLTDHPRADEGLARAWRALDRQYATELGGYAQRRLKSSFLRTPNRLARYRGRYS